ncbi:hypothetical protein QUF50_02585 [Thiotrichales bacterium HSG1]|nr:hypothetical protein [Thiotrichales bacterium HSG1]
MQRCSICRGRFKDNTCLRCGADLTILLSIEQQVEEQLKQALSQLGNGNLAMAKLAVERSLQLKREPLTIALYNFINSIPLSTFQSEMIEFENEFSEIVYYPIMFVKSEYPYEIILGKLK